MAILTLRPTSDHRDDWVPFPSGAGTNWERVNEDPAVDTDYVSDYQGGSDSYNFQDHTTESGTINSVTVYARTKGNATYTEKMELMLEPHSGSCYYSDEYTLTNAWVLRSYAWTTNPYTSAAWTWADIDAIMGGINASHPSGQDLMYVSQVYIEVDYDIPGSLVRVATQLGTEAYLYSLCVLNGELYGGTGNGLLLKWNGVDAWVQVAPEYLSNPNINSMCVYNGELYACSWNSSILKWNGVDAWILLATCNEGTAWAIISFNDRLYIGTGGTGYLYEFNPKTNACILAADQCSDGETAIRSLCVLNGQIYGGSGNALGLLLRWDGVYGHAWVKVAAQTTQVAIYSLCVLNGEIYGGTGANGELLKWDGVSAWVLVASQYTTTTSVYTLSVINGEIYGGTQLGPLLKWNGVDAWILVAAEYASENRLLSSCILNKTIYVGTYNHAYLLKYDPGIDHSRETAEFMEF